MKTTIPAISIGLLFIAATAVVCQRATSVKPFEQLTIAEAELRYDIEILVPTFQEFQTMLDHHGYELGPDGIDGHFGTDSMKAWDRAICDRWAAEHFQKVYRDSNGIYRLDFPDDNF